MASPSTSTSSRPGVNPGKLRVLLEMIKWEHTVFALPFAYAGMLAAPVPFSLSNLFWITVAMIGARTAGMTLNRTTDAGRRAWSPPRRYAPEPHHRRRHRRQKPPHRGPRHTQRARQGKGSMGLYPRGVSPAGTRDLFSGPDNAVPVAARRPRVFDLSLHQKVHLALPFSPRDRERARARGGLGGGDGRDLL